MVAAAILTPMLGCARKPAEQAPSPPPEMTEQEQLRCEQLLVEAEAAAQPAIHVSSVTHEQLARALGPVGASVFLKDHVILRVSYRMPGTISPEVRLLTRTSDDAWPVALVPAELTREKLLRITEERLMPAAESPPESTSGSPAPGPGIGYHIAEGVHLAKLLLMAVTIVPVIVGNPPSPPDPKDYTTREDPPTPSPPTAPTVAPEPAAPMTEHLLSILLDRRAGRAFLFRRPKETNVSVRVRLSYGPGPDEPCPLARNIEFPLPAGESMEERVEARFQNRFHPLWSAPSTEAEDTAPGQ